MAEQQQEPVFQIQRVYLKEASLEQPNSPAILLEQEAPTVDIQLQISSENVADGIYETAVTATVQTKIKDKTVFLAECRQAAIFEIRNLPEDQMGPVLGIACPQIVYPYLRGNLADLITRAGFPPVHLAEINFQAMYEQQQAQQQQEDGDASAAPAEKRSGKFCVSAGRVRSEVSCVPSSNILPLMCVFFPGKAKSSPQQ